jgi:hypothetical protein
MLFKDTIAVYTKYHNKTRKYKMYNYWLVKQVVHIIPSRL